MASCFRRWSVVIFVLVAFTAFNATEFVSLWRKGLETFTGFDVAIENLKAGIVDQTEHVENSGVQNSCTPPVLPYSTSGFPHGRPVLGINICDDQTKDPLRPSKDLIRSFERQLRQTSVLLKSIALMSAAPVHVAFVVDSSKTFEQVLRLFKTWSQRYCRNLTVSVHNMYYPPGAERFKYMNRPCSSQRHFFAQTFPYTDLIINIDTDVLLLAPVEELWSHFRKFNQQQFIGMSALAVDLERQYPRWGKFPKPSHDGITDGINTGISLFSLARWRQRFPNYAAQMDEWFEQYGADFKFPTQDLFNVLLGKHPEIHYKLPCTWNLRPTLCRTRSTAKGKNLCSRFNDEGAKALHGAGGHFVGNDAFPWNTIFRSFENFSFDRNSLAAPASDDAYMSADQSRLAAALLQAIPEAGVQDYFGCSSSLGSDWRVRFTAPAISTLNQRQSALSSTHSFPKANNMVHGEEAMPDVLATTTSAELVSDNMRRDERTSQAEISCSPTVVRYSTAGFPAGRPVFGINICNDQTSDPDRPSREVIRSFQRQLRQMNVLLRSMVLFSSTPIHFALVVDTTQTWIAVLQLFQSWPQKFCDMISFSRHDIYYPASSEHLKYMNRPCSSQRHFFPQTFPHTDHIINIDTDIILLASVEELWSHFEFFNSSQIVGMSALAVDLARQSPKWGMFPKPSHEGIADGINTGISLFSLSRWRENSPGYVGKLNDWYERFGRMFKFPTQDLFNVWLGEDPEIYYELPCVWNVRPTLCRTRMTHKGATICKGIKTLGMKALHGAGGHFLTGDAYPWNDIFETIEALDMATVTFDRVNDDLDSILRTARSDYFNCSQHLGTQWRAGFLKNVLARRSRAGPGRPGI